MTSVQIMNRLSKLEQAMSGTSVSNVSESVDSQKLIELEKKVLELTKKNDEFQKITNENTKNIAQNLKTLQEAITKLELVSKNTKVKEVKDDESVDDQQTKKKK